MQVASLKMYFLLFKYSLCSTMHFANGDSYEEAFRKTPTWKTQKEMDLSATICIRGGQN